MPAGALGGGLHTGVQCRAQERATGRGYGRGEVAGKESCSTLQNGAMAGWRDMTWTTRRTGREAVGCT